jgi:hypothetical protein
MEQAAQAIGTQFLEQIHPQRCLRQVQATLLGTEAEAGGA